MDALNAHLDKLMHMMGDESGQQNHAPTPTPASNPIVLAKPQPFDGTRGTASKAFVGQIGLHAIIYTERFPTNARKVAFAILFMRDYAATWFQGLQRGPVVLYDFLNDFKSSLQEPCWPTHRTLTRTPAPLENIQLTMVMSNIEFDSLPPAALIPNPSPVLQLTLSDTVQTRRVQQNLCFRCGQGGHISRGCLNGG
ncbi:uncharacterized protein VP01_2190g7, partial [Puccinia sorghi]